MVSGGVPAAPVLSGPMPSAGLRLSAPVNHNLNKYHGSYAFHGLGVIEADVHRWTCMRQHSAVAKVSTWQTSHLVTPSSSFFEVESICH